MLLCKEHIKNFTGKGHSKYGTRRTVSCLSENVRRAAGLYRVTKIRRFITPSFLR